MTHSNLVALKLSSALGDVERDIVVQESITLYNLHKVIQFCLAPSRGDEAIAGTVSSDTASDSEACVACVGIAIVQYYTL